MSDTDNNTPAAPNLPAAIRFIGDLVKVKPEPGDLFVLTWDQLITEDTIVQAHREFRKLVPECRLLVLGKGMSLEVMGASRALARLETASKNTG